MKIKSATKHAHDASAQEVRHFLLDSIELEEAKGFLEYEVRGSYMSAC